MFVRTCSAAAALMVIACAATRRHPEPPPPVATGRPAASGTSPDAARSEGALRRLTRWEYDNAVRDLLGDRGEGRTPPSFYLPGEPTGSSGFPTPGLISEVDLEAFRAAAEGVVSRVRGRLRERLPSCRALDDACVDRFTASFGRRAFRRPMSAAELASWRRYDREVLVGRLDYPFDARIEAIVRAFLQSPQFLYHWEVGDSTSDHALAARLAFFLWSTIPDDELMAAADTGRLSDPAELDRQVRRMVADSRLDATVQAFVRDWLGLGRITAIQKDQKLFTKQIFHRGRTPRAMEAELRDFVRGTLVEGDGKLRTFLTTPWTRAPRTLAALYEVAAPSGDEASVELMLDPETRPGILTRAGFLAVMANAYEGDPIKRGLIVRERLLCQPLAPPPGDIPPLPPPTPGLSARARHEDHVLDVGCRRCHEMVDPIGFGFGQFDAIGRFVATEAGEPIDVTGEMVKVDGRDHRFETVAQLIQTLAQSLDVHRCHVRQWLRFALRREIAPAEEALVSDLYQAFSSSGGNVRELLLAITRSPLFRRPWSRKGSPS